MRTAFYSSLVALLVGTGVGLAQDPDDHDHPQTPPQTARGNCVYGSAEYLLFWFRKSPEPVPLVTTTSATTFVPFTTGALDQPRTSVVLGGSDIDPQEHSGGLFTLGVWCDEAQTNALEGSYF